MLFEHTNHRSFLKALLVERSRNGRYSLRRFAQELGMAHPSLSAVLNGKSNFSPETAHRIATRLSLAPREHEYFCLLVQADSISEPAARESLRRRIDELSSKKRSRQKKLSADQFRAISEWHPMAILALAAIPGFELTPNSAAARLGISRLEADVAIERMIRLGLLHRNGAGKLTRIADHVLASSPRQSGVISRHFKSVLVKTAEAIERQGPDSRISGLETMPVDKRVLPEAKQIIEDCFQRIVDLSMRYPQKSDVYQLSIHFYNLTHKEKP